MTEESAVEFADDAPQVGDVRDLGEDVVEDVSEDVSGDVNEDAVDDVLVLEEVDEALVLPVWEPTGEPRVDEALDELTRLDPGDVHQHAEVFAHVHERLRDVLSNLDSSV